MFKDKLKKLREQSNLTLEELSKKTKIPCEYILSWENGDSLPNMKQVKKLAKIFNVNVEELLDRESYLNIYTNYEESYSNKRRVAIAAAIIVVGCTWGGFYSETYNPSENFHQQSISKSFLLDEYGVEGLKESENTFGSEYLEYSSNLDYYADITSKSAFESYAEYVFGYLLESSDVYDLSFMIEEPIGEPVVTENGDVFKYLVPSSDLCDYSCWNDFEDDELIYDFYYFVDSPKNVDTQEKKNVKCLHLVYDEDGSELPTSYENDVEFPDLIMEFSTEDSENSHNKYYFASAYFSVKEDQVTNENFRDYFSYSFDDILYGMSFTLEPNYTFARVNISLEIDYKFTSANLSVSDEYLTEYINPYECTDQRKVYPVYYDDFEIYSDNGVADLVNTRLEITNAAKVYTFTSIDLYA